jgi:DNA-binding protein HU-beta
VKYNIVDALSKEDFASMAEDKTEQETTTSSSNTIGRQELTRRIAKEVNLTQKQAAQVLEVTLETIRQALQDGREVRLVGFGSFRVRQSAARRGVNPRNGQNIEVPAKERVRFSPGKELADAVVKK